MGQQTQPTARSAPGLHLSRDWVARTRPTVSGLFADRVEQDRTPSACFAVFDAGGIVYGDGFGRILPTGAAPTLDTGYRIASCTKSFTAALMLILRDRGQLRLDEAIGDRVATGPLTGPQGDPVRPPTLAELASMSGGMPTDDPWADRQESLSPAEFDRMIAAGIRFSAAPGQRYEYSNLGYALLGRCLEQATGSSWHQLVTTELLDPLGLDGIRPDANLRADAIADGHRTIDGNWIPVEQTGPGAFSAIGGLYATARSLADWGRWLAAAWTMTAEQQMTAEQHEAASPLSAPSRTQMETVQRPASAEAGGDSGTGYGYGLQVFGHPRHGRIVHHSGGYPGYGSHMRWHPASGIGIVALENATYSGPSRPAATALELILDEVLGGCTEPVLWSETAAARLTVERLIRDWDPAMAADLFADNVCLDEPLERRRAAIADLIGEVGPLEESPLTLADSAPVSSGPGQLSWSIPGRNGLLRCGISLTPQEPPRVQTLTVRRG